MGCSARLTINRRNSSSAVGFPNQNTEKPHPQRILGGFYTRTRVRGCVCAGVNEKADNEKTNNSAAANAAAPPSGCGCSRWLAVSVPPGGSFRLPEPLPIPAPPPAGWSASWGGALPHPPAAAPARCPPPLPGGAQALSNKRARPSYSR